ncbi:MAG TPA: hypothetical protein VF691_03900, partial [Cytophagaceae bacterium]|jgi:hypothetical protein
VVLYKSLKDLILEESHLFRLKEIYDFEKWLKDEKINGEYINQNIMTDWSLIRSKLLDEIRVYDITKIYDSLGYLDPIMDVDELTVGECKIIALDKFALVTAKVNFRFFAKVFKPDPNEAKFTEQHGANFKSTFEFNFTIQKLSRLQFKDLELIKISLI